MKEVSISELIEKPISGEWGSEAETGADGTPVIRNTNFSNDGRIDLHDVAYRVIPDHKIEKKRLLPGDIIIEKSGGSENQPVGRVVFFDIDDGKDYLFSNFTSALRPKQGVESKYIHYALLNAYLRGVSELFQNKTTGIRNLQLSRYLDKIKIPLPSLEEQKAIVAKLDRAQRLIDIDKAMLAKYDQLIQSVFLEMFGDPVSNPMGWEVKKFDELVAEDCPLTYGIVQPGDEVEGGIPCVRPVDLTQRYVSISGIKRISPEISKKYSRTLLKGGEILLSVRGSVGEISIADYSLSQANVTRGIVPIWFDKDISSKLFFYYLYKTKRVQEKIKSLSRGATLIQLNLRELRSLELISPPRSMQEKFEKYAKQIHSQWKSSKASLLRSEALFSSLVQEVFG